MNERHSVTSQPERREPCVGRRPRKRCRDEELSNALDENVRTESIANEDDLEIRRFVTKSAYQVLEQQTERVAPAVEPVDGDRDDRPCGPTSSIRRRRQFLSIHSTYPMPRNRSMISA